MFCRVYYLGIQGRRIKPDTSTAKSRVVPFHSLRGWLGDMRMVLSHMEFLLDASTQAGDKRTGGGVDVEKVRFQASGWTLGV